MKGRMGLLIASAAVYMLCISLPVIVVEQITGFWKVFEQAMEEYIALFENPKYEAINAWALAYSDKLGVSIATFIFLLLVPGPLTLGLSTIWLHVIRRKEAYTDMVLSGFSNFLRTVLMDTLRRIIMALLAILLIIPGIIAYYRYSLAFFLLADNPEMKPFEALIYSRYYMQRNKGSRFLLDLSFIGWFALSIVAFSLINDGLAIILSGIGEMTLFSQLIVSFIISAIVFAPVCAYRGVAAAEYYHRVICMDPKHDVTSKLELPSGFIR